MEFIPRNNCDTETNVEFKSAVMEELIEPAVGAIDGYNDKKDLANDEVVITGEVRVDDERIECSVSAKKYNNNYTALAVTFSHYTTLNPTNEAVHLIYKEIQDSTLDTDTKVDLGEDLFVSVETYLHRSYYIQLSGEGSLRTKTTMGYAIKGQEIDAPIQHIPSSSHDHLEHDTTFGNDEIFYLAGVLMKLGLVSQEHVNKFEGRNWGTA